MSEGAELSSKNTVTGEFDPRVKTLLCESTKEKAFDAI